MGAFLKKNWPLCALFVAVGAIMTLAMKLDQANDNILAGKMAGKALTKIIVDDAKIIVRHQAAIDAKDKEMATLQQGVQNLGAKVVEKHKQLTEAQAKNKDLAGCNLLLDDARAYILKLKDDYSMALDEQARLYTDRFALQEARENERVQALTRKLDQVITSAYRAELRNSRKLIIGPQVHYGTGGMSVGFGVTWELWRVRAPGQ
jgi:hypothetical protein